MMQIELNSLHQVAGHVEDLAVSRKFFEETLGLTCLGVFDPPGLLFFDVGGTRLLLEKNVAPATLYFGVEDIHASCDALQAKGVEFLHPPTMIHKDEDGTFGDSGDEEWMAFLVALPEIPWLWLLE